MKNLRLTIPFLFLTFLLQAQRGQVGSYTVSTRTVLNEYTPLTIDASAGTDELTLVNNSLNQNNRFPDVLKPGDLILIIQMQGAQIKGGNVADYGMLMDYQGAGNQEWAEIKAVLPDGRIQLTCGLRYSYRISGKTQVLRVPRLQTLRILQGGIIASDVWNGNIGGIIAIECEDSLLIESGGLIDASASGFRGGRAVNGNPEWAVSEYVSAIAEKGAEKGESIAGFADDYLVFGGRFCRGAAANGGGGGNAHNCGGGGGSNGGLIANWTGNGNPDTSNVTWKQGWELESAGFATQQSDGGGRGGYSFSGVNNNALVIPPGVQAWDGDWRRNNGGLGGRPLEDAGYRLFAGGGGGAGDANDNAGGSGGTGGGIIAIRCYGSISGSGMIVTNGGNGATAGNGSVNGKDGAGGGGGGGSILMELASPLSGISLEAKGGKGGNQDVFPLIYEGEGPGGGGGGGRVIMPASSINPNLSGGSNGSTDSWGLTEFPSNGATSGGKGSLRTSAALTGIRAIPDTICTPGLARLVAIPAEGQEFFWTDRLGGEMLSSADTLDIFVTGDTTVYLSSCYPVETIPVQVFFTEASIANAGPDTVICASSGIQLQGSGAGTLHWSGFGIDNPNDPAPQVYPVEDSWYVLTIRNKYGCSSSDSVFVALKEMTLSQPEYEQLSNFGLRFFVDSIPEHTYFWLIEDSVYEGAECLHEFPYDGNYEESLCIRHACGIDTLYFPVQVVKIASTGEQLSGMNMRIYPNPAAEMLYFQPQTNEHGIYRYFIYESSGRLTMSGNGVLQDLNFIETSQLSDGVYLLEVQTDNYIYRSRFIRQLPY